MSERKEFTLAEALAVAEQNATAYENIPSVSRTLIAELDTLRRQLAEAEAEVLRLRQGYWDARAIMGFDNDGCPTPIARRSDFVLMMLDDAASMRRDYDEAGTDAANMAASFITTRDKLALAEHDARRYRFIRDRAAKLAIYSDVPVDVLINGEWQDQPDQLDVTVSAAIAAGEGKDD